jgi:hypothetical protein
MGLQMNLYGRSRWIFSISLINAYAAPWDGNTMNRLIPSARLLPPEDESDRVRHLNKLHWIDFEDEVVMALSRHHPIRHAYKEKYKEKRRRDI